MRKRLSRPARRRAGPGLAAGLACACAGLAPAGAGAPDGPAEAAIVLYETATVRARPVASATAAVTVIDRETIEALDAATVAELIRFAPGLDVIASGPRGGLAWGQVRGGEPNFTAVLVDGVPLNDLTDAIGGGLVDLGSLPADQVERIEIVRGPLSSYYGSTGLAGVIHVITRRGGGPGTSYGFDAAAGDAATRRLAASVGGGTPGRAFHVGASWDEEEGRVADDRFEQASLVGSASFGDPAGAGVRVSGRVSSGEADDYPDASGGPTYGDGRIRTSEHDEVGLGVELRAGHDARHEARVTYYRHALDRDSPAIGFEVPASMEHTRFTSIEAGWSFAVIDGGRQRLSLGAGVDHERGDNDSVLLLPPAFGGDVDGSYEIERTTGGVWGEVHVDRGRLGVDLGARVDLPEGRDAEFNPRAGVAYRIADGPLRVRASAGRSFKLPGFFALASPAALGGNPDLEPETGWGADTALEWRAARGRASGSLGVFYNRFENLVDFDFDTFAFVNRSEVETEGVEATVRWTPVDRLTLEATATRQEVDEPGTDVELRQRPDWIGAARVSWRPVERLRAGLDLQAVSRRFDRQIPVPERREVAGYGVVGATLAWTVRPGWTLHGRVDNALDRDYETFIGFPGPGPAVRVGLRYEGG